MFFPPEIQLFNALKVLILQGFYASVEPLTKVDFCAQP